MPTVIDDGLLARVIVAGEPGRVASIAAERVLTTGLWWFRLANAVLRQTSGQLSAHFADVDVDVRHALVSDLPSGVEVLGLTTLTPTAATLARQAAARGIRLNALAAEAVAAAFSTGADLLLAAPSPSLQAASEHFGFGCRVVD